MQCYEYVLAGERIDSQKQQQQNSPIGQSEANEPLLKPEDNAQLDIPNDIQYHSHFFISLENDRVLKEGLIDCLSYEPLPNGRVDSIIEKLNKNTVENLNDQEKLDLLQIFPSEENTKITQAVLETNPHTERFIYQFQLAKTDRNVLDQLRQHYNVQMRQQEKQPEGNGIQPYQPPVENIQEVGQDEMQSLPNERQEIEENSENELQHNNEHPHEHESDLNIDSQNERNQSNQEILSNQSRPVQTQRGVSNYTHPKLLISSKNLPKQLDDEDDMPKAPELELNPQPPLTTSNTKSILKQKTNPENTENRLQNGRRVQFSGIPNVNSDRPEPKVIQSEQEEFIEFNQDGGVDARQHSQLNSQPQDDILEPLREGDAQKQQYVYEIPKDDPIDFPISNKKLTQLQAAKMGPHSTDRENVGFIRSKTKLIKNSEQDRQSIRTKVEQRMKARNDQMEAEQMTAQEKKQIQHLKKRAVERKKRLSMLKQNLKRN